MREVWTRYSVAWQSGRSFRTNGPHNYPFDGLIDELSVYNRAVTSEEVAGIFEARTAGKGKLVGGD